MKSQSLPAATNQQPLVYSCSGCSSAAQMANHLAVRLGRAGTAEMSCIAGVGGDVPSLVRTATSGRPAVVLDGCALNCARHCLARHGVTPALHIQLHTYGVKKRQHLDFDPAEADVLQEKVEDQIRALKEQALVLRPSDAGPSRRSEHHGGEEFEPGELVAALQESQLHQEIDFHHAGPELLNELRGRAGGAAGGQ